MSEFWIQSVTLVLSALAVSVISVSATKSALTREIRQAIATRHQKLGILASCPYCLSHSLSFVAVILVQPTPVHVVFRNLWFIDYIISAFAMVGVATITTGLIYRIAKSFSQ